MLVLRSCDHYALGGALELSFYLIVVFIFTLFVQSINRSKFKYSFNLFFSSLSRSEYGTTGSRSTSGSAASRSGHDPNGTSPSDAGSVHEAAGIVRRVSAILQYLTLMS